MSVGPRLARLAVLGVFLAAGAAAAAPAAGAVTVAGPAPRPGVSESAVSGSPVSELNVPKAACGAAGMLSKLAGVACGALSNGGALIKGGKQLITGHVGGAIKTVLGAGSGTVPAAASTALGLAAIGTWVVGGAGAVLHEAAAALGATTTPQLESSWFSATYWRMAAIAAMLTLPFLFAATVQAALRSDVSLLARAALGYLPLAMLSIAIAAPLTTLLLAASDEMSGLITSAASQAGPHLLERLGEAALGIRLLAKSPFMAFLIGLFLIGAAFALWVELLLREAAVYVVVLMLPLAFAAMAWPARRIWAVRAVELLVALILSKFAIAAVLSLGGAAINASLVPPSITGLMAGTVLLVLATLSPWALLRLVPLAEIAAGAAGGFRGEMRSAATRAEPAVGHAKAGSDWVNSTTAAMKRDAQAQMAAHDDPPRFGTAGGAEAEDPDPSPAPLDPAPPASASQDHAADAAQEPSPPRERPFSEQKTLELGPNFGDTVVWPHPEAE